MAKKVIIFLLMIVSVSMSASAGTINNFNWEVPNLSMVGTTYGLTLTENTNKALDVQLSTNGNVKDKVEFWTIWFHSEARKSESLYATEGGNKQYSHNLNMANHAAGDQIFINFKNANGSALNGSYYIKGSANYH